MKRLLFICFFGLFYITGGRSEPKPVDYTTMIKERLKCDYLTSIDRLLSAVRYVESGMNDKAVGAMQDVGPLQIVPSRLRDYNQKTGKSYSHRDCFKWEVSKEIFLFYANRIGNNYANFEQISRRWNRASQWQDEKGKIYWEKVSKHLNKSKNV